MSKQVKIVPDDLILCINDFKRSLNDQTINVMGKDYATVALRLILQLRLCTTIRKLALLKQQYLSMIR